MHVKYPLLLSDFNETCMFSADFREKAQISNFVKIRPVGAEMFHADGRTHIKLIVNSGNFPNAPNKGSLFFRFLC